MADDILSLSGQFSDASEADWLGAVEKALKGRGAETLNRLTDDGLTVKPLYRSVDWPIVDNPLSPPGTAPFLRGPKAVRDAYLPWDIRQTFAHPDPATTNAEILRDLERGVSSVELAIDPAGQRGCGIRQHDDLTKALDQVDLTIAPVALAHAGTDFSAQLETAHWLIAMGSVSARRIFNLDPLGQLARTGLSKVGLEADFAALAQEFDGFKTAAQNGYILRADGHLAHEAGGSEAEELACMIASAIDTLRRLDQTGIPPAKAAPCLLFTLATGANYGVEIAKIRAARRLWARCLDALNLDASPMALQCITSARMLTRYDPWVNLLRNTAACFAAGAGGADTVTVRPFTDALGLADELGRRTARNTQIIAQEEAFLGRVADPAGGAWFIERLASDLAEAAWAAFQSIESEGGYGASLMADAIQSRIGETRIRRAKSIAKGKLPITGVSAFPILDEIEAPVAAVIPPFTEDDNAQADSDPGESLAAPLWPVRLAIPFERLRDHASARKAETGQRPTIFLATLGPLAEHTARADYARNLFAAGGIEAVSAPETPPDLGELTHSFKASGCTLAILCGSDARYGELAIAAAKTLKSAGVQRLYLAGRPGENEAAWRAAGVDSFVYIGVDMIATLELAHAELGITR